MLNVVVLAGEDLDAPDAAEAAGRPDVAEALAVGAEVRDALSAAGMRAQLRVVRSLTDVRTVLDRDRPDLVFPLVESLRGREACEPAVAGLLERAGVPFAGSSAATLRACLDKAWTATALARAGVPIPWTAAWRPDLRDVPFPAIVKPRRADASVGITAASVVGDLGALDRRAREVASAFGGEVVVQAYLPGRELNVALLGGDDPEALPPSEIDFTGFPPGRPPIVTYDAKWNPDSPEYTGTVSVGAVLDDALRREVIRVARQAWKALGVRDYGRVDLRLDAAGVPRVLEVNPNCDLARDAGFARTLARAGREWGQVIADIARGAFARGGGGAG